MLEKKSKNKALQAAKPVKAKYNAGLFLFRKILESLAVLFRDG